MRLICELTDEQEGNVSVRVKSNVVVRGIFAQFGQSVILQISDYLFEKFTESVREVLEGD